MKVSTLIFAVHHPHASFSLERAKTSTSWFSTNSVVCFPESLGGKNTCENGNFDSGCQLQNEQNKSKAPKNCCVNKTKIMRKSYLLIFKGYENLVVEHVGDNGL